MLPKTIKILHQLIHASLVALLSIPLVFTHIIYASSAFHPSIIGFDISYPQCGKQFPNNPAFAVVGVNGGKAFKLNPCFKEQYDWMTKTYSKTSVYLNIHYPSPSNKDNALLGPRICTDIDTEKCLGYNYAYQAAKFSHEHVIQNNAHPKMWWLDIETMNTWSDDITVNQEIIQGAIDYLLQQNQTVGIYSTASQWKTIAGDFKPVLPVWTAGPISKEYASKYCNQKFAFTGGKVQIVQYVENDYDNNYLCR